MSRVQLLADAQWELIAGLLLFGQVSGAGLFVTLVR